MSRVRCGGDSTDDEDDRCRLVLGSKRVSYNSTSVDDIIHVRKVSLDEGVQDSSNDGVLKRLDVFEEYSEEVVCASGLGRSRDVKTLFR